MNNYPLKQNYKIIQFKELGSTNSYCLKNINDLEDKSIITANIQTSGRGRLNRKWISNSSENLYFSILLKPQNNYQDLPLVNITQYMSIIICELLKEYNLEPIIKWPNDILVNNRKIAGILSEVSFSSDLFNGIVIGAGINTNFDPSKNEYIDRPVTSIYDVTGYKVEKSEFLNQLLELFFKTYELFMKSGFLFIKNKYIKYFPFIGKGVEILEQNKTTKGKIKNIADNGTIVIVKRDGSEKNIILGDLTCSVKV